MQSVTQICPQRSDSNFPKVENHFSQSGRSSSAQSYGFLNSVCSTEAMFYLMCYKLISFLLHLSPNARQFADTSACCQCFLTSSGNHGIHACLWLYIEIDLFSPEPEKKAKEYR